MSRRAVSMPPPGKFVYFACSVLLGAGGCGRVGYLPEPVDGPAGRLDAYVGPLPDADLAFDAPLDAPLDAPPDAPLDAQVGVDASPSALVPVIVATGADASRYLSMDEGTTWCLVTRMGAPSAALESVALTAVGYHDGLFIAIARRRMFASTNGWEWTEISGDAGPVHGNWAAGIVYGNDWWVSTGGFGTAMRSRDGFVWEDTTSGFGDDRASRSLAFGNGMFVTGRDDVGWWSSTDGASWTQIDPDASPQVIFRDGAFVALTPETGVYDFGRGMRLRYDALFIERSEDRDGAPWTRVSAVETDVYDFAFGSAAASELTAERLPPAFATCLGI